MLSIITNFKQENKSRMTRKDEKKVDSVLEGS